MSELEKQLDRFIKALDLLCEDIEKIKDGTKEVIKDSRKVLGLNER